MGQSLNQQEETGQPVTRAQHTPAMQAQPPVCSLLPVPAGGHSAGSQVAVTRQQGSKARDARFSFHLPITACGPRTVPTLASLSVKLSDSGLGKVAVEMKREHTRRGAWPKTGLHSGPIAALRPLSQ